METDGNQVFITLNKYKPADSYGFSRSTTDGHEHSIRDVDPDGIADRSGLEEGDLVTMDELMLAKLNPLNMELMVPRMGGNGKLFDSQKSGSSQNYDEHSLSSGISMSSGISSQCSSSQTYSPRENHTILGFEQPLEIKNVKPLTKIFDQDTLKEDDCSTSFVSEDTFYDAKSQQPSQYTSAVDIRILPEANKISLAVIRPSQEKLKQTLKKKASCFSLFVKMPKDDDVYTKSQWSSNEENKSASLSPISKKRIEVAYATAEAAERKYRHKKRVRYDRYCSTDRDYLALQIKADIQKLETPHEPNHELDEHCVDDNIYFMCDFIANEILPRNKMLYAIETRLRANFNSNGIRNALTMVYTLNNEIKRANAISVINEILNDILAKKPKNKKALKYRISMSEKKFQENIRPTKGAIELLKILGFREEFYAGKQDRFLLLKNRNYEGEILEEISYVLRILHCQEFRIPLKLHRNTHIYKISSYEPVPNFCMVNRNSKYTIIQIRFPNDYILEGTFEADEKFSSLRSFVDKHLALDFGSYRLVDPLRYGIGLVDERKNLFEYGLVPNALLMFEWENQTLHQLGQLNMPVTCLAQEFENLAINLN